MNTSALHNSRQRGAVLIMVLWTAVVLTVLVTVLASNVRLSANTALYHRQGAQDFANVMSAMYKAEMELMMERMPLPPVPASEDLTDLRVAAFRFNGQPLTLHYGVDENMVVRIYDHAGKINITRMRPERLQQLIEARLGENFDPLEVQDLLSAWSDWVDLNDVSNPVNGAENDYYLSLDPPYTARNSPEFDSVEEIRLIRGFDELFKDVNLDAAFTVYGSGTAINPNLATREALQLLPGMDDELVEQIIAAREQQDIRTMPELGNIVPFDRMQQLSSWFEFGTSGVYSVYAYPQHESLRTDADTRATSEAPADDPVTQAYMQIMEVRGYESRARIYKVHPYARLPDTSPARQ